MESKIFFNLNDNVHPPYYIRKDGNKAWIKVIMGKCNLSDLEDIEYAQSLVDNHRCGFCTEQEYLEARTPDNAFMLVEGKDGVKIKVPMTQARKLVEQAMQKGEKPEKIKELPKTDKLVTGTMTGGSIKELKKDIK